MKTLPKLTRHDFTYMYAPDPLMTIRQKMKRFFAKCNPLFWTLVGTLIYPTLIALMQLLDYMDGVR